MATRSRRRTPAQRVEAKQLRSMDGQQHRLTQYLTETVDEQQRRDFWLRLGAPVGPLPERR